ncbi:MAG: Maf family protein [Candidatus Omnitrophica bacterium]|nr:Maf family protein [Candidatus Omnitrophota bacterium]
MKLILASASKRRAEILRSCGIKFEAMPSRIKEKFHHRLHPKELVLHNARIKAKAIAQKSKRGIILGCDTLVLFKSRPIGKPKNKEEAAKILKNFSGNKLFVYTGMYLLDLGRKKQSSAVAKTELKVKKIVGDELNRYLSLLGPYDKAGGFSIEGVGSMLFDELKGSYFNVLGLPMNTLAELFKKLDLNILDFINKK